MPGILNVTVVIMIRSEERSLCFSLLFYMSNSRLQESNVDHFETQRSLQENRVPLRHGVFAVVSF